MGAGTSYRLPDRKQKVIMNINTERADLIGQLFFFGLVLSAVRGLYGPQAVKFDRLAHGGSRVFGQILQKSPG